MFDWIHRIIITLLMKIWNVYICLTPFYLSLYVNTCVWILRGYILVPSWQLLLKKRNKNRFCSWILQLNQFWFNYEATVKCSNNIRKSYKFIYKKGIFIFISTSLKQHPLGINLIKTVSAYMCTTWNNFLYVQKLRSGATESKIQLTISLKWWLWHLIELLIIQSFKISEFRNKI